MLYPQNVLSIQNKIYKNTWGLILLTYSFTVHYHKTSFFQIQVHGSDYASLYEHIPKKFLPTEYGGDAGSLEEQWGEIHKIFFNSFNPILRQLLPIFEYLKCGTWKQFQKFCRAYIFMDWIEIVDHLSIDLSNGHTRIFGTLSVGKRTRNLKTRLAGCINYISFCMYVDVVKGLK